jgi:hypothetical protein
MNTFQAIDISYLRSNRTVETILLRNPRSEKTIYVYNYEGWHFRIFESIGDVLSFFNEEFESTLSFENEKELETYLTNVDLETAFSSKANLN